ncbi:MAG: hypothetical protein ACI88H_000139, partial [Cocleimonas sp.]
MANKNYQVGLLITGDAKKGVKATQLTRDGLKDLSSQQKRTSKSTKDLTGKTGSMIAKFGKVTGAVGLVTATLGSMGAVMRTQTITEMKVMADTLNLSTQTLSEWNTAGEKYNITGEKMANTFKDIQDKIGDLAANGQGEAKDVFEKLNLDINEFVGLGADQQLLKVAAALDDVASHSEKIFYLEALANDASRLLPLLENGAFGLKTAQEEARLLGTSINDVDAEMIAVAGREMQRMGDISTGLGNTITAAVAPALGSVTSGVTDVVLSFGGWETIVDSTIDSTLRGIGFVLDRLKPLHVMLLTSQLGWLQIGQAATSAMASSAQITADVINTVLEPFQALLWGIADGWGTILIGLGEFTGDSGIVALGESLKGFASDVSEFSVSADDIVAADKAMSESITNTKDAIVLAKGATRGADLIGWWNNLTKAQKESAIAAVKVKEAQRALGNVIATDQGAGTNQLSEDYDKLIKQVDDFSGAWASAGNVIVDSFGSIGQQMEKMFVAQEKYSEGLQTNTKFQIQAQNDIAAGKKGAAEQLEKLKKDEIKLNYASTQAEINSYGSIAGAAADMFGEKTAAAKTFHAIEQIMAIASLAMSVEKMVMGTTETGVHIANETTKQSANALTAITSAFAAPFPINFVAGAAMIGIMASLIGGSFGSSGSAPMSAAERQETQGTGTVLGSDDKSASINNSFERIEELELDQYAELREMNSSLSDLNNNITHLATSFVSNFGKFDDKSYSGDLSSSNFLDTKAGSFLRKIDPVALIFDAVGLGGLADKIFGGFSSKKKSLIDSGISIVSQTMGDVIDSGLLQAQQYFDIKTKKKKYWGLSSKTSYNTEYKDINEQLEHEMALVFGGIGNTINSAVDVLGFDLSRNLDNFVIDLPSISFKDLSGDEIQAELQAIFSSQSDLMATYLVPGIQSFQQVGEGLYETLIRVAQEQAVFNGAMQSIGKTLGDVSATVQIELTQSLVELMGGIESFSESTSAYFDAFFSEEEKFSVLQNQLISLFNSSSKALPETRKEFRSLIDALDLTSESGQKAYASLVQLSPQLDEYYAQLESLENNRQAQVESIINQQNALFDSIFTSLSDSLSSTVGAYINLLNADVNEKIRSEQQRINDVNRQVQSSYKEQLSAVNALHSASTSLNTLMQSLLLNDLSTLDPLAKFDEAQNQFDSLFTRAENGDVDAANGLGGAASTLLTLGKELFSSSATYKDLFVDVNNQLSAVADITAAAIAPTQSDELTSSALLEQLNNSLIVEEAASQSELLADILTQLESVAYATGDDVTTLAESLGLDLDKLPGDIGTQIKDIGLALDATIADINSADSIDALGDTLAENFALSIAGIDTSVDFTALITAVKDANDATSLESALANLETAVATVGGDVSTSLSPWFDSNAL